MLYNSAVKLVWGQDQASVAFTYSVAILKFVDLGFYILEYINYPIAKEKQTRILVEDAICDILAQ